jgi:chemotaxis protein methyltransferase CheR
VLAQLVERAHEVSDLSEAAIARAVEGVYSAAQFEAYGHNYGAAGGVAQFGDYFQCGYGRASLRPDIKRKVVFFQHNLASDHALGEMQLIFCRNVLIYFGAELARRVVTMLRGALSRGGLLCLGGSEHVPPALAGSFDTFDAAQRIYRRRDAA